MLWVLAFTIVPLVYSLYAAFHNVTNETVMSRTEVPRLGKDGNPVLKPDGTPRMKTETVRETVTKWEFVGLTNFARIFSDRGRRRGSQVTAIFVAVGVSVQMLLGLLLALLFNRARFPGARSCGPS